MQTTTKELILTFKVKHIKIAKLTIFRAFGGPFNSI